MPPALRLIRKTGVFAVLEAVDDRGRAGGSSVEVAVFDPLGVEAFPGLREKTGELAEHQHPMALAHDVPELLHQRVEFGERPSRRAGSRRPTSRVTWRRRVIDRRILKRLRLKSSISPRTFWRSR